MPLFLFSPLEQFIVSLCAQTGKDFSHQSDAIVLTFGLDILNELDLLIVPDFLEMSTVVIFDEPVNQASWFFVFQLSNFVTQLALLFAITLVVGFFYSRNHFFFFPLRVLVAAISAFVRDLLNENFVRFGKYFYSFFFFCFFFSY